jgi:hypothetical protein
MTESATETPPAEHSVRRALRCRLCPRPARWRVLPVISAEQDFVLDCGPAVCRRHLGTAIRLQLPPPP